ncbi:outer membrane protein assembly factor BamB family protein [Sorangium sp. So ce1335]|uniref:outer membrane protein assembly factor BamB family protein n=1 Tax=Sorangium sp. So ce1335 TaxID=3133335 RepID=UPI003F6122CE
MNEYRTTAAKPVLVVAFLNQVFGVDPATGRVLWEHKEDGLPNSSTALLVTPAAIYAATFSRITCLRYPTGELLWQAKTAVQGRATLLLEGDRLFVARLGEIECFSLTGQSLWHNRFKGKGMGPVALGVPDNVTQSDDTG